MACGAAASACRHMQRSIQRARARSAVRLPRGGRRRPTIFADSQAQGLSRWGGGREAQTPRHIHAAWGVPLAPARTHPANAPPNTPCSCAHRELRQSFIGGQWLWSLGVHWDGPQNKVQGLAGPHRWRCWVHTQLFCELTAHSSAGVLKTNQVCGRASPHGSPGGPAAPSLHRSPLPFAGQTHCRGIGGANASLAQSACAGR